VIIEKIPDQIKTFLWGIFLPLNREKPTKTDQEGGMGGGEARQTGLPPGATRSITGAIKTRRQLLNWH